MLVSNLKKTKKPTFYILGCDGIHYQPNQIAHVGYGCLGTEEDLRYRYGAEARNELTDYYIIYIYNKIRQLLGLPTIKEVASFDSNHYCCERPIPLISEIPKEYQLLFEFVIGVQ